ncbi:GNAT family N-acetyltransferase [Acholeplasma sp. OttesenSCG-928-E16]|nr:GNAT family N-acetyltransferase [Acholeplasma sp. OttesenSCG-928-E16]
MIRKIRKDDRQEYIDMSKTFFKSNAISEPFVIEDEKLDYTFDLAINNSEYIDIYVYEKDNKLAGYALMSFTYSNDLGGLLATIEELFIKKEYRGLGIGDEFMSYIESIYPEEVSAIRLEVVDENYKAKSLYEKHGFEEREYIQMIKLIDDEE